MKKVSVIIPVFHVENFLEKCVNSVLNQTYRNIELILVDDGGDDRCPQICENFASKDERVKCIHKKNEGQSFARKTGVEAATGDYFLFIDADDWIDEETLEVCVQNAESKKADVVCFGYKRVYDNNIFNTSIFYNNCEFSGGEVKILQRRMIGLVDSELNRVEDADRLTPMWGKLYHKNVVQSGRWVSERETGSLEDSIFNLYALNNCKKFVYVNRFFYNYVKTNESATTGKYRYNLVNQWKRVYKYYEEYIDKYNCENTYKMALKNRIVISMLGLGMNEVMSSKSFLEKARFLEEVLDQEEWKNAYNEICLQCFSLKWRIFFFLCKAKKTKYLLVMIIIILNLKSRFGK